jgi:D-2-hydroxyacid dehydrogenase (NADP+)
MAKASRTQLAVIGERTGTTINPHIFVDADNVPAIDHENIEVVYASSDLFTQLGGALNCFNLLDSLPKLRWVHLAFAGIDHPRFENLLGRGVRLSNSPGAASEPIAHTAMAGLLSLARRLPYFAERQRKHLWERLPSELIAEDLSNQTLVVYGMGAIGGELARLARAFGLYVIGVRRNPQTEHDEADEVVHPDVFDLVLPRADWLAVTANLTSQTRGAISAARLKLLPIGAHVINVARGPILDQEALIARLQSGAIGGAYLDVFETEPLPSDSLLWDLPNVIITPHTSWSAKGNADRARAIFLNNLEGWLDNGKLATEVHER